MYKILSEDAERYEMTYVQNPMELSRTQLRTEISEGEGVVESYRIINDKKTQQNTVLLWTDCKFSLLTEGTAQ